MPVLSWDPFIPPTASAAGQALLHLPHPLCMQTWPAAHREQWIDDLAAAISWGFCRR